MYMRPEPAKADVEAEATTPNESCCRRLLRDPAFYTVLAVVGGASAGVLCAEMGWATGVVLRVLGFPGTLWLKALNCVVLPMVVMSMIQSMVILRSLPSARAVAVGTLLSYLLTTLFAAILGCLVSVLLLGPLMGYVSPQVAEAALKEQSVKVALLPEPMTLLDTVVLILDNTVPSNLVADMANGNLLPVIVAAIVFGLLIRAKNADGTQTATLVALEQLNEVVTKVLSLLVVCTPLGVSSLAFTKGAIADLATCGRLLGALVLSMHTAYAIHSLVMYPLILLVAARRNPLRYLYNTLPAAATAFGSASSAATLPVTIRCVEGNKVRPDIAKFVLSLGATINMDGTTIWIILGVFFLGRIEGVQLDASKFVLMALLASLCSLGTAPVPASGLFMLATMMSLIGVPLKAPFSLLVAVDWLADRGRAMVNVTGDSVIAAVIQRRADFCEQAANAASSRETAEAIIDV